MLQYFTFWFCNINIKGTCPDMCPEKERYGRSAKNQLRFFEKEDGLLNHLTAVKVNEKNWNKVLQNVLK